jgi:hypothetical protein
MQKFSNPEKNIGEIGKKLVANLQRVAWTIARFWSTVKDCE